MLEEREQSGYFHHKQSAEYYKTIELALVVHPDMLVTVPTYKPARYYTQLQNFLQDEPGVEDPREFFEGAKQTAKRRRRATSNQVRTTQRLSAAAAEPSQLVDLLSDSSELSDKGAPDFSSDAAFHNRMETDAEEQVQLLSQSAEGQEFGNVCTWGCDLYMVDQHLVHHDIETVGSILSKSTCIFEK